MSISATTIVCVKKDDKIVIAGDGQASLGNTVIKNSCNKLRELENGNIIAGFAGSAIDGITLFERLENKLSKHPQQLMRAAVELAKDWRNDKYLRRLEAVLIVASKECMLMLSGNGDILEPDDNVVAVGSGGNFAFAAAKALLQNTKLSAEEIAKKSLLIAAEICVFTNSNIIVKAIK